eukprot:XP_006590034.1 E3 ubiquitin-protein ligase RFWD3 [Glycine max]
MDSFFFSCPLSPCSTNLLLKDCDLSQAEFTSPSLGGFTFTRIVFQVPAWSCSWDLNNSHYIYAGLQNGSVLVFDMRKTAGPMKSLVGFTSNPVHTVHALAQTSSLSSGVKTILSASVVGLCQWNIDSEER